MSKEKAPAFQFYPKDFLTDERVVLMSNTELGSAFRELCGAVLHGEKALVESRAYRFVGRVVWNIKPFRPAIPMAVRREVFGRDGGLCRRCRSAEAIEYDHVIPYSRGGPSTAENLQLLCKPCNRKKSNRLEN